MPETNTTYRSYACHSAGLCGLTVFSETERERDVSLPGLATALLLSLLLVFNFFLNFFRCVGRDLSEYHLHKVLSVLIGLLLYYPCNVWYAVTFFYILLL